MKKLKFDTGGRPRANDDLVTLQDELHTAILAPYLALPWSCVLVGCDVVSVGGSKFNVSWGLVYFNGEIQRFEGAANVSLPAEMYRMDEVLSDYRAYQTGGSKPCMVERKLGLRPVTGGGLLVTADGVLRIHKAQEAMFREVGERHEMLDFSNDYDATGKGKYGTRAYGWALCNTKNGTSASGGLFSVGYLAGDSDYGSTKKTGGKKEVVLEVDQMPAHNHDMGADGQHTHDVDTAQLTKSGDDGTNRWVLDPGNPNPNRNGAPGPQRYTTKTAGSHKHTIQDNGGGGPHENRPPYIVVAFKQWIGW